MIIEYKIDKDGRMGYFKLIRADGSSKRYSSMIKMLQDIDREDLETLWKLVKAKHGNTRPEEDYERVLWGDLKVMFEPDIKSEIWRNLQVIKVDIGSSKEDLFKWDQQFKLQKVWTLVDLPYGKKAIGTKWVYRNKKDERGIVVRNKSKTGIIGLHSRKGIDYMIESAFLYGKIEEEVYVYQPPGFEDPEFPDKVYKVKGDILLVPIYIDDINFGSTKKELCTEFEKLMHKKFQMSSMGEITSSIGLQVKQKEDVDFISQDKFQVTPKVSHLHAVKRIFRYLKGQPKLGLWYPKDSPFDLEAYSDSDYAGASLDRKSTTGGCQFLRSRLISWQCKKQTIVANSTTEAEYVAAANCCGQVLWIQNQMLDYGYNFMNTKIFIDNESTICIVKNPVFHSKTKHIEIRHHFIRDSYEKRLIQVIKIHTDHNVADLLTKALDVSRFQFLTASIGMLNL
ncbi:putative reverse transcriptase, RNA-dependent DNA polymerase [Tanacetum coccineum]